MKEEQASRTASMVGENLVFMSHDPEIGPLLPPGAAAYTAKLLVNAGATSQRRLRLFPRRSFRRFVKVYERMVARGQTTHMALRKRFVEDEVRAAIAGGAQQVLMLGAGFDALCPRLAPEHPEVRFVEVDHPATHQAKARGIRAFTLLPPNLHFLSVDLERQDLEQALRDCESWVWGARSAVVAEGLLMYLDEAAVRRLLAISRAASGHDSTFVFTYMMRRRAGRVDGGRLSRLNDLLLAVKGEPYQWAAEEGHLAPFLRELGYHLEDPPERCDLARRYLEPAGLGHRPIGRVERLGVARILHGEASEDQGTPGAAAGGGATSPGAAAKESA